MKKNLLINTINSNTTLVKVKCISSYPKSWVEKYSNTTLVKVKLKIFMLFSR